MQIILQVCPECRSNNIIYDEIHDEKICRNCGLVLSSPPIAHIIFPGVLKVQLNKIFIIELK